MRHVSTGLHPFFNHNHAIQRSFTIDRVKCVYYIWVGHWIRLDERRVKHPIAWLFKPCVCYVFLGWFVMCVPHFRPGRLLLFRDVWKVVVYRRLANFGMAAPPVAWRANVMTLRSLLRRLFISQSELIHFFLCRWCAGVSGHFLISLVYNLSN